MREACTQALACVPSDAAYNVGAVLVSAGGVILAAGRSRELPGNTHAEECALIKCGALADPHSAASAAYVPHAARGGTMYTTMEPCSQRLSGKPCCCDLLLAAGIARVVMAVHEPPNFVRCEGVDRLRQGGVAVRFRRGGRRRIWRNNCAEQQRAHPLVFLRVLNAPSRFSLD